MVNRYIKLNFCNHVTSNAVTIGKKVLLSINKRPHRVDCFFRFETISFGFIIQDSLRLIVQVWLSMDLDGWPCGPLPSNERGKETLTEFSWMAGFEE